MTELNPERLLRTLVEHEVEFCVIGAVAAWLQGSPAVTLDLDVMPRRDLDNAERLAAALNSLDSRLLGSEDRGGAGRRRLPRLADAAIRHRVPARWTSSPRRRRSAGSRRSRRSSLALGDVSVRVITIDEVIASKEELGRPKDTAALPALYATREALRRQREAAG